MANGGTIGIVSGDLARYSAFARNLMRIERPADTQLNWVESIDIAAARNVLVRQFLETDGEWLWMIDDDMVCEADTLMRLIATPTEIVQPLVLSRVPPHHPTAYRAVGVDDNGLDTYMPMALKPGMTIVPVDACGTGGMLIRRHVLTAMEAEGIPWFEVGQLESDHLGEDLWFCQKAKADGFTIHVDTDIRMGHITPIEIWPHFVVEDHAWMTEIRFAQRSLLIPSAASADTPTPPSR